MPQYTENFNMTKISLGDSPPDITVLNSNFDTIDSFMAEISKERVSLTGMGNTVFQSTGTISKTGLDVGELVCLAKFIAPCDGLFKVSLTGYYPAGYAMVYLLDDINLALEAANSQSPSFGSATYLYNHSTVGAIKKSTYVLTRTKYIIDLENTNATYTTDIFCKAGQPYMIFAQVYEGSNSAVTVSNVTVTYGND